MAERTVAHDVSLRPVGQEYSAIDAAARVVSLRPRRRWDEFVKRYASELRANPAFASLKTVLAGHPKVTLLYSSHDSAHNNAAVLREVIEGGLIVDLPEKSRGGGAIATGRPAASKPKTD